MSEPTSVLVVDDNEDLLQTFEMILKKRGFAVETAPDGLKAVEKFGDRDFDVTLMDIVMPNMNGVEAFRHMKRINPQARVILMTAYSDESLVENALREGAHCVVHKPLRIDQMIQLIQDATVDSPILLVDDDPDILEIMTKTLTRKGYQVITATSGEEAIRLTRERPCQLAFIDVKLPVLNGLETYLKLKELHPSISAIMMTGYRDEAKEQLEKARAADAVTCLYKPFDPVEAVGLINQLGAKATAGSK